MSNIKYLSIFFSFWILPTFVFCQYNLSNPDIAIKTSVKHIDLIHLVSKFDSIGNVSMGEILGQVAPFPKKLSNRFDSNIQKSKKLYTKKKYKKAVNILEEAIKIEPTNPFILYEYARATYRIKEKAEDSYKTYKKLVRILDSTYNNSDSNMVIDFWFKEAYWKLGTLHMDHNKWSEAFYEINRFIGSIQDMKGEFIYEQALSYLTECAFEMGEFELSTHFANRTLFYNPKNEYVKYYLKEIKRKK